ncbi:hypothetical protein N7517_002746 [Penicillium concentricum]|uniref:Uncharacterized protein n=1 Tax=Penicillium concentricum TaxID=293559 RepID=A0A9W9VLI9_9EURO|nr:uncharacterized protein N7517_002746 [Penicillium concentricum]KAJ5384835.1 hypothetical protein N7517_002746 [Penicillium concentricum]
MLCPCAAHALKNINVHVQWVPDGSGCEWLHNYSQALTPFPPLSFLPRTDWCYALLDMRLELDIDHLPHIFILYQFLAAVTADPEPHEWIESLDVSMDKPAGDLVMDEVYQSRYTRAFSYLKPVDSNTLCCGIPKILEPVFPPLKWD